MSIASTTPGATSLATDWTISVAPPTNEFSNPSRRRRPRSASCHDSAHPVGRRAVACRGDVPGERIRQALDEGLRLGERGRVDGDADVEAVAVAEGRDVHRAAEPWAERVARLDQRAADVPFAAQARDRRCGEVDRLGLGLQRRHEHLQRQTSERRRHRRGHPQGRLTAGLGEPLGDNAELRSRTAHGGGHLEPSGCEPVPADLFAVTLPGRRRQAQLGGRCPELLVITTEASGGGRDEEVVAAAPERQRGGPCAVDRDDLEVAEQRTMRRACRPADRR